ncbi:MAG: hypothetical protein HRT74_11635, partial [Flavobacteriales bacterium]|nr:hypothetical protein [Flavobacteriales bacterium]
MHESQAICELACSNIEGCIDPDLTTAPVLCSNDYEPVCGCDGVTYINSCVATF